MEIVETYLKKKDNAILNVKPINDATTGANIFRDMFGDNSQECLGIICLDVKNVPTHFSIIYKGTTNCIVISPKDILKVAILSNATSIIMGHNHPSSDLTPSEQDILTTRNIAKACVSVGLKLLDHLIVNSIGDHYSIREHHNKEFGEN